MPEPKPMKKCQYCETDPTDSKGILCPDCSKGNSVNLFMKCRKCNSNTSLFQMDVDCLGVITTRLYSGMSTMKDLVFTGRGFLLWIDDCPVCSEKKQRCKKCQEGCDCKREKPDRDKAYWEKI